MIDSVECQKAFDLDHKGRPLSTTMSQLLRATEIPHRSLERALHSHKHHKSEKNLDLNLGLVSTATTNSMATSKVVGNYRSDYSRLQLLLGNCLDLDCDNVGSYGDVVRDKSAAYIYEADVTENADNKEFNHDFDHELESDNENENDNENESNSRFDSYDLEFADSVRIHVEEELTGPPTAPVRRSTFLKDVFKMSFEMAPRLSYQRVVKKSAAKTSATGSNSKRRSSSCSSSEVGDNSVTPFDSQSTSFDDDSSFCYSPPEVHESTLEYDFPAYEPMVPGSVQNNTQAYFEEAAQSPSPERRSIRNTTSLGSLSGSMHVKSSKLPIETAGAHPLDPLDPLDPLQADNRIACNIKATQPASRKPSNNTFASAFSGLISSIKLLSEAASAFSQAQESIYSSKCQQITESSQIIVDSSSSFKSLSCDALNSDSNDDCNCDEQSGCTKLKTFAVHTKIIPQSRPRDIRMNGEYYRVFALESLMRRHGKLDSDFHGRAQMVLAPRSDFQNYLLDDRTEVVFGIRKRLPASSVP